MRYVKTAIILCLLLMGIVGSVQAKSGSVPAYEQKAADMYEAYRESIKQQMSDFVDSTEEIDQDVFTEIEENIASEFGTNRKHVKEMIAEYKQKHVTAIETETDQLKESMLEEYRKDKEESIKEEMTDEVTSFLDDLLTE